MSERPHRSHSILLSTRFSSVSMGQQRHEVLLESAMREAASPNFLFRRVCVGSMRARSADVRGVPTLAIERLSPAVARLVGSVVYGRADLLHRFDLRCPPRIGPEVITIHDLAPLRFADEGGLPPSTAESIRRAHAIICPSVFAAEEVSRLYRPRHIVVAPNGVTPKPGLSSSLTSDKMAALGIGGRFAFHAGGATERKNLAGLAAAWQLVAATVPDVSLVLCGPPDQRREHLLGLPRTRYLGYVSDAEVAYLLSAASVVIVPSMYEGFGLPALEAMAAGTPVVAARAGALPEVCGDAALVVEPTGAGLATGIHTALTDTAVAEGLRKAGPVRAARFTWRAAAEIVLGVYRQALT